MAKTRSPGIFSRMINIFIRKDEPYPDGLQGRLKPWNPVSRGMARKSRLTLSGTRQDWRPVSQGQESGLLKNSPAKKGWIRLSHPDIQKNMQKELKTGSAAKAPSSRKAAPQKKKTPKPEKAPASITATPLFGAKEAAE